MMILSFKNFLIEVNMQKNDKSKNKKCEPKTSTKVEFASTKTFLQETAISIKKNKKAFKVLAE